MLVQSLSLSVPHCPCSGLQRHRGDFLLQPRKKSRLTDEVHKWGVNRIKTSLCFKPDTLKTSMLPVAWLCPLSQSRRPSSARPWQDPSFLPTATVAGLLQDTVERREPPTRWPEVSGPKSCSCASLAQRSLRAAQAWGQHGSCRWLEERSR